MIKDVALLLAVGSEAWAGPLVAPQVTDAVEACAAVKAHVVARTPEAASVVAFCDPIADTERSGEHYVMALHSNRVCDGICSTHMGWFAVRKSTGEVTDWDITEGPPEAPVGYLVSIVDVPVDARAAEKIEGFALATWGVRVGRVCHVPEGWTIRAGGSLTPQGVLEGHGSQGVSWFAEPSPPELRDFVLVTLHGPLQRDPIVSRDGDGEIPATFAGAATIETDDGVKEVALTTDNIRLTPAEACPER